MIGRCIDLASIQGSADISFIAGHARRPCPSVECVCIDCEPGGELKPDCVGVELDADIDV